MEILVKKLIAEGYLKSQRIIEAFLKIDRADFIRSTFFDEAYGNYPLSIGFNQTISQPATVAFMLELLNPQIGDIVLDIGSGSGWQTALLAFIVSQTGKVYAIERIKELKEFGEKNCQKYHFNNIKFIWGDGSKGLKNKAPFNRIIVAAAASEIPEELKEQLKIGGRLVIPVGEGSQEIVLIERLSENKFREEHYPGFVFVPLISD